MLNSRKLIKKLGHPIVEWFKAVNRGDCGDMWRLYEEYDVHKNVKHFLTGLTALHIAVEKGYFEVVKFLLERNSCDKSGLNVDVNEVNLKGETPLMRAMYYDGRDDIIMLLLEHGALYSLKYSHMSYVPKDLATKLGKNRYLTLFRNREFINHLWGLKASFLIWLPQKYCMVKELQQFLINQELWGAHIEIIRSDDCNDICMQNLNIGKMGNTSSLKFGLNNVMDYCKQLDSDFVIIMLNFVNESVEQIRIEKGENHIITADELMYEFRGIDFTIEALQNYIDFYEINGSLIQLVDPQPVKDMNMDEFFHSLSLQGLDKFKSEPEQHKLVKKINDGCKRCKIEVYGVKENHIFLNCEIAIFGFVKCTLDKRIRCDVTEETVKVDNSDVEVVKYNFVNKNVVVCLVKEQILMKGVFNG